MPYISPEQLEGDSAHLDRRSDVYSLGVVLCELLCGERPHDLMNKPLLEAARTLRESPPRRPGARDASIPRDLDVITLHALHSDPHDRYASAAELAADLRRYLSGETILARSPSTWYAARKFAQRNRALVGAVLGSGVLLALAAVVAIGF